ncbi:MAG TPA: hypothetical protein DHW82_00645 [Spirochaetia bacterium]|nr:MAG: hypothetical protein A2Y41_08265 [Spirochaetes bacterium GWB1_36_13]HCL55508.1 hypothetical protein [Spirochaetia bacterium]
MKNKLYIILFLMGILFISSILKGEETASNKETKVFYVLFEGIRLREKPGLDSKIKILDRLYQSEEVTFLGETSKFKTKITLRNKDYESVWYKVQKKNGSIGWAFGAALSSEKVEPWRVLIVYDPGNPEEASEDWLYFTYEVSEKFKKDGVQIQVMGKKDSKKIKIGPDKKNPIMEMDLKDYLKKQAGYLLLQAGKDPFWIDHSPSQTVIDAGDQYFYKSGE